MPGPSPPTPRSVGRDATPSTSPTGRRPGSCAWPLPVALAPGERFVLRRGPTLEPRRRRVLDVAPPRGALTPAPDRGADRPPVRGRDGRRTAAEARIELHGADGAVLAGDVATGARNAGLASPWPPRPACSDGPGARSPGRCGASPRSAATMPPAAAAAIVDRLVDDGRLERDGDRVRRAGAPAPAAIDPGLTAAMDRLEAALDLLAPPPLAAAARAAACPPAGIRALERAGRIVVLERGPGLRDVDLPRPRRPRPRHGGRRAADSGRLPRRHRDEPQVRHGDPRGPRPPRRSCGGPRPGTSRARRRRHGDADGWRSHRAGRWAVVAVRARQAGRAARWSAAARPCHRGGAGGGDGHRRGQPAGRDADGPARESAWPTTRARSKVRWWTGGRARRARPRDPRRDRRRRRHAATRPGGP